MHRFRPPSSQTQPPPWLAAPQTRHPRARSRWIGNDETTNPKPDPQPYLLAAERLGVDPTQCVTLEDSPSGVRSATAAGMRVIVVPGELEVPAELGTARLKHEELTLEAVRALA